MSHFDSSTPFEETPPLKEQIAIAIADYVAGKTDTHGFSRLDSLIAWIEERRSEIVSQLDYALSSFIRDMPDSQRDTWVAIFLIVRAADSALRESSLTIVKQLDRHSDPLDPQARYHAYRAYLEAGGRLTKPQLDEEKRLKAEAPAQWSELVLWAFRGSPASAIRVITELLVDDSSGFTWKDVSHRLQYYYEWFGPEDFNRGMQSIIAAVPELEGRSELANKMKKLFDVDVVLPFAEKIDSQEVFFQEMRIRIERLEQAVQRAFNQGPSRFAASGFAEAAKDLAPRKIALEPPSSRSPVKATKYVQ